MVTATVVGQERAARKMAAIERVVQGRMEDVVERFCLDLSARVKARKLSGQVLNVQTGRLRRSVHHEVRMQRGTVVGAVGTNVEYARIHEYGGRVTVPQHNRLITQAWGRPLQFPVYQTVKAHDKMFPQRSFLRSALQERESHFRREVDRAVRSLSART